MLSDKVAERLFKQYSKRLYNTALRITLSEDEADEIMQETLIRFITGKGVEFSDKSEEWTESPRVWTWLRTTCVRLSIDWLRSRKRFISLDMVGREPNMNIANGNPSHSIGDRALTDAIQPYTDEDHPFSLVAQDDSNDILWDELGEETMPFVLKIISELPDGYRTILTLKLIEEYEYHEIAAVMGISENGVRSQYMRARHKVADKLRRMISSRESSEKSNK